MPTPHDAVRPPPAARSDGAECRGVTAALGVGSRSLPAASTAAWTPGGAAEGHTAAPVWPRALVHTAVGLAAAGALTFTGHGIAAAIVAGLATAGLLLALIAPRGAYARLTRATSALGDAVGHVVGAALLIPLILGVFTPFRLLFRRGRRDPLHRTFDRDLPTYWRTRTPDDAPLERRKRLY